MEAVAWALELIGIYIEIKTNKKNNNKKKKQQSMTATRLEFYLINADIYISNTDISFNKNGYL